MGRLARDASAHKPSVPGKFLEEIENSLFVIRRVLKFLPQHTQMTRQICRSSVHARIVCWQPAARNIERRTLARSLDCARTRQRLRGRRFPGNNARAPYEALQLLCGTGLLDVRPDDSQPGFR